MKPFYNSWFRDYPKIFKTPRSLHVLIKLQTRNFCCMCPRICQDYGVPVKAIAVVLYAGQISTFNTQVSLLCYIAGALQVRDQDSPALYCIQARVNGISSLFMCPFLVCGKYEIYMQALSSL